jgi:hypothetical protein
MVIFHSYVSLPEGIMRHTLMISKIFLQGNDDGTIFDPNFHRCWSLKSSSCVRVSIFWPALKSHGCVFSPQKSRPTSRMILHDCFPAWDICRKTSETPIITGKNHGFCLRLSLIPTQQNLMILSDLLSYYKILMISWDMQQPCFHGFHLLFCVYI